MATKTKKRLKNRLNEIAATPVLLSHGMIGRLMEPPIDATTVSRHFSGERGLNRDQVLGYAKIFGVQTHEIFVAIEDESDGK